MGIKTIALTGAAGGALGPPADCLVAVPSRRTPLNQQVHVCVYYYLCHQIEVRLGG
jgi:D-sedoheptulose 7-phosphate isomerase